MSTSSTIPRPTAPHTASQSLSPSNVSAGSSSPSPLLLQAATSVPVPSPSGGTLSILNHLQYLLDVTSTLLALFIASVVAIMLIYWASIHIIQKLTGKEFNEQGGFGDRKLDEASPSSLTDKSKGNEDDKTRREVNFAPHPSDKEFTEKAQDIRKRLSGIQEGGQGSQEAGLGDKSAQGKGKVVDIAKSTGYEGLGEATGRKVDDSKSEAGLEFQRGVTDVRGDIDGVERRGGGSYGSL
ncbi:hypothetical protein DID88_006963 [Monilinia fructigena]|uniref:Uncharacterized protein n=1 Tax=Monilinia fructigena TaxID=38457 RepID=A0A395IIG6_9HELO|nr:hypothetical protein DID88_006963 [Monilinia fructigena]